MSAITKGHFGKYFLVESIGSGGMAQVYLARHKNTTGLTKPLALKIINPAVIRDARMRDYFKHEAELVMGLDHANVTNVQEFGETNGQFYLAMDFIVGKSLYDLAQKLSEANFRLSPAEILFIAREICEGLRYVHTFSDPNSGEPMGIIHRDISPQNIMLTFEGEVKIIDFGVARTNGADSLIFESNAGKLRYMSPEQMSGGKINQQIDIYSAGIVLWELAAGEKIFADAGSADEIKERVTLGQIPNVIEIDPDCPEFLNNIIRRATHFLTDDRYATAQEMLEDCNLALNKHFPSFNRTQIRGLMQEYFAQDQEAIKAKLRMKIADVMYHGNEKPKKKTKIKIYREKNKLLQNLFTWVPILILTYGIYLYIDSPLHYAGPMSRIKAVANRFLAKPNSERLVTYRQIYVNSNPSGAEIQIPGATGHQWTPASLNIPSDLDQIILVKQGYRKVALPLSDDQIRYQVTLELE